MLRLLWVMPKYIRPKMSGATVFFTVALGDRASDLLVREIDRLRAIVAQTMARRPFQIDAWVVLPDHLHAVWTLPGGDSDYSTRWAGIKSAFSRGLEANPIRESHLKRREKGIWQRRFWEHHIRDAEDFAAHVHYCWGNPVKHGLVKRPIDWPYSSIHRDIRLGKVEGNWAGKIPDGRFGERAPTGSV